MAYQHTEVDGVATLVAPAAGPTMAGLSFRVGRADETLAKSGISHLLEHLALFPLGLTDYHYNGSTGPSVTSFYTSGNPEDVASFLSQVCDSIHALPLARLDTERSIIRTEWAGKGNSIFESSPTWRYGARNYGLLTYREPGIRGITPYDLTEWAATWFTRENAVLWVAGDIPPGLRLRLPSGRRRPVAQPTSTLPQQPAFFANGKSGIAMDAIIQRRPAATIFAEVLERALFRRLRQEGGLSYTASTNIDVRGDGYATLSAAVDALPEKLDAALGEFIDTLAALRVGRIDQTDVSSYLAKIDEAAKQPEIEAGSLPSVAFDLLTGVPVISVEERFAQLRAVTPAEVHAVAEEAMSTALLMVPQGRKADWAGFTAAPIGSTHSIVGESFASKESQRLALYVGPDGVMSTCDGVPATARYDQLAAVMAWPDGARQLVANDGYLVHVEPTLWHLTPGVIQRIDAAVPAELVIPMPAREPGAIPRPEADSGGNRQAKPRKQLSWGTGSVIGVGVLLLISLILCCIAGSFTGVAATDDEPDAWAVWMLAIFAWVVFAIPFGGAITMFRHRRRRN